MTITTFRQMIDNHYGVYAGLLELLERTPRQRGNGEDDTASAE
jgi:hypothetical protein